MTDPFQNVDAAGPDFIAAFAEAMDARQADPTMEAIVADYLGRLSLGPDSLTVEVGAGAGAVSRRIAAASAGQVIGFEPSEGFVREARARVTDHANLRFEVADGTALPQEAESVDHVILHTVLSHVPDPALLIAEAHRVLKPGGVLVVRDADFSKATLAGGPTDPLEACARAFIQGFVTDAYIVGKLRDLLPEAGFEVIHFATRSRTILDNNQMLAWVEQTSKVMLDRGEIGAALRDGLVAEYLRRAEAGRLFGFQVFGTAVGRKT